MGPDKTQENQSLSGNFVVARPLIYGSSCHEVHQG
jgi:hypothetical protein